MTIKLDLTIELSTIEDRGFIERSLCSCLRDILSENPELLDYDEPGSGRVLAIIEDVEVRVG